MWPGRIGATWLALWMGACGGKTMATGYADASDSGDAGAPEAGSDGSDAAAGCLAAGGECLPYTGSSRSCLAMGFQDCGQGEGCCLDVCDPKAPVIRASSYDQTCAVDTDCAAISEGSTCNACNFACPNAAINVNALPQYSSSTAGLSPAAYNICPNGCPFMGTCCRGGTCQWGYTSCSFSGAQPVDSGADSGDAGPE